MADAARDISIVDDDADVRDSLAAMLGASGYRCATFASGEEFLAGAPGAGCAIVDVRMPTMDGLAVQAEMRRRGFATPVIFLTGFADVPLAVQAMKAGAVDFVEKPCEPATLRAAIERALALGAAPAAGAPDPAAVSRIERLTPRERDVLEWLVAGASNKIVAWRLGISPRTVEIHRARVMEKAEVRSLSELVRLALAAGVSPRES